MIHFFIGTKAQLIKLAPVIEEILKRQVEHRLIDTSQHSRTTAELIRLFKLRGPDVVLNERRDNIDKIWDAFVWFTKDILKLVMCGKKIRNHVFQDKGGVCVVHGDTLSTLLSLLYAKRCGLKVVHVESGLRSYDVFNPFPEEIIRLISMKMSDYLIAPSRKAFQALCSMGYRSKSLLVEGNSGKDAALKIIKQISYDSIPLGVQHEKFVLVTIHRAENIYNQQRMKLLCDVVKQTSDTMHVVFVLHDPTRIQLKKFGLLDKLSHTKNVSCVELQPYNNFLKLMINAGCVMTDGGSIQEECSYFDIPCIVLRSSTERSDGLGKNAILSNYDVALIHEFVGNVHSVTRNQNEYIDIKNDTSRKIAQYIEELHKREMNCL
ncbi:UDP-N-acetylglucosamine 2-epimerase [Desulfoluna spongiiphila]|uniref:UDP-N-acetylglucosamine 2-epimerase (Non-hydrolysing) n=1 Tax=Desulfoluna spongiiphila TaxID=419481 RepID=A0A1G5JCX8_9BACT|nr:UDP-N-acetylglucosamine 2-epimerase [Desulfoluna spongiiphila]SCY86226.1 UDP-N-acetylglucosamine 2-epimerase (non-hydrolysing) [Desulfoluna spongiiphila]